MGNIASTYLCSRGGEPDLEKTIEDKRETNNNVIEEPVVNQPIGVEQPEATSTPKMSGERRAIVPLPIDRDITERGRESSYEDSLESDMEGRAISERMSGSDSGLEHSADELEVGGRRSSGEREVEVAEETSEGSEEPVSGERSDSHEDIALDDIEPDTIPYLNTVDSDSENEDDNISDSVTEPATDIATEDLLSDDEKENVSEHVKDPSNFANFPDIVIDEDEKMDLDIEKSFKSDEVLSKAGEVDTASAITSMLSQLSVDNDNSGHIAIR